MRKAILSVLCLCVCFLMVFSVFRALRGGEPLTVNGFLQDLNLLDWEFDNLYHYISLLADDWEEFIDNLNQPLSSLDASSIKAFVSSLKTVFEQMGLKIQYFFNLIGTAIKVVFGFLFDFVELFVSIIKVFFSMLGIRGV